MSDPETAQDSHQGLLNQAAIMPPAASDSSPLSEVRSEHELDNDETMRQIEQVTDQNVEGEGRQEDSRSTSSLSSPQPTPDDDGSATDAEEDAYDCDHCGKVYVAEKSLKRHLADKKTKCFKSRPVVSEDLKWSCSRCHALMGKKYSVERHIKESCWKICDECVESDSLECDASYEDGDCTTCVKASKACTKHDKQIPDSVPELLMDTPAEPNNAESRIRSATHAATKQRRTERPKRQAPESPDASPQSKPKRKYRARKTANEGDRQFINESMDSMDVFESASQLIPAPTDTNEEPKEPLQGLGIKIGQGHSVRRRVPPSIPSQPVQSHERYSVPSLLPPFEPKVSTSSGAYQSQHEHYPVQGKDLWGHKYRSPMPPPTAVPASNSHDSHYDASAEQILRNHNQRLLNMQMASQAAPPYTLGQQHLAPLSSMRSSLHLGQNGWPQQPYAYAQGNARSSLPSNFQVQQNHPLNFANHGSHISAPNSQAPSRRSSTAGFEPAAGSAFMVPQMSGNNSRTQSRHSSVAGGQLSAPGSRMQSRQPSRQSSPVKLAPRPGNLNQTGASPSLVVKLPLPRELKMELTLTAPVEAQNPKAQPLCLRIHSNTYDSNNTPIFSILSILRTEPFGPRLDYYCQTRNKRFNVDYKFIFKYPAPTADNLNRKRYYDIVWNATPNQLRDKEYPGSVMKDGDTIYVVHKRTPVGEDADDLGTQLDVQRIHIQDGETFQNPGVMDTWYQNAEHTLAAASDEVAELKNQTAAQEQMLKTQAQQIQQLCMRNAHVMHESSRLVHANGQMRLAMMPGYGQTMVMPQQQMQLPSGDPQLMARAMAAQSQVHPNDPQMVQFRARQQAAQRAALQAQVSYNAVDQGPGHQSMYATAGNGNYAGSRIPSNGPPMGTFSAPVVHGRRSAPVRDDMDEDAEGEDDD